MLTLAVLHAAGENILGVEVPREVFIYSKEDDLIEGNLNGLSKFGRDIDVLVKQGNREVWHEQKSWKGRDATSQIAYKINPWAWGSGVGSKKRDKDAEFSLKSQGSYAHRQFVVDHIAKELGALNKKTIITEGVATPPVIGVSDFKWSFLKFKRKLRGTIRGRNPSQKVLDESFEKLPTGVNKGVLSGHTGRSKTLKVSNISLGALGTLLSKFESEFAAEIMVGLDEIEIELD